MNSKIKEALIIILLLPTFLCAKGQGKAYRDSLQRQLLIAKNDTARVKIINFLTQDFTNDNSDSALYWGDRGLKMANTMNWQAGISVMLSNLASIYSNRGDQNKAISYLDRSVKIDLKPGNERNLSADYINLASAYHQLGNNPTSFDYLFKALDLSIKVKDDGLQGLALGNIGDLFREQKNYTKSKHYYQEQLKLGLSTKNAQLEGIAYKNLGDNYILTNQNDSARIFLEKALKQFRVSEDDLDEAIVLSHLSQVYQNNDSRKLQLLFQAQKIFDRSYEKSSSSIENVGNIGGTYASMGLKDSLNQFSAAEKKYYLAQAGIYLQRSLQYARETKSLTNISYYSDNLAQVQEASGDYAAALANFKISKAIDDSLYSQDNKNALANREAEYLDQLMIKRAEVHKLELQKFWLIGGIVLALIAIIAALFINLFRFQKLKMQQRLRQKEAEEQTKELLHKNHITESELKAIRSQMNPHFIFNVLNSLESYILDNDKQSACRLVQKFAGLSRLILENSTQSFVQVSKEWKALILYTELQALRYGNNFSYQFTTDPDIDLQTVYLPPMLIQPLIENAIIHGVLQNTEAPQLKVSMVREQNMLKITVEDNGPGLSTTKKVTTLRGIKEKSLGVQFIRERIEMLNEGYAKQEASFVLQNNETGQGTKAILVLPVWTGEEMLQAG